jgi:hypothetical protein
MNKGIKVYQQHIILDYHLMDSQMILIYTQDGKIIGLTAIPYPPWLKFIDERFEFCPINYN